jgi:hypothetical protein
MTQRLEDPLKPEVEKWAIKVDGVDLTYGNIHELIHRDIVLGNDYRKERIKLLITLATGVFALTVTFHKDLLHEHLTRLDLILVLLGWVALLISLAAGILHFGAWENYYLEFRAQGNALWRWRVATDADSQKNALKAFNRAGQKIQGYQVSYRKWNFLQSAGLVVGLALIGLYVASGGLSITSGRHEAGGAAHGAQQSQQQNPPQNQDKK